LKHVPLSESVAERHNLFLPWMKDALPGDNLT
jgi:hypothetical protein